MKYIILKTDFLGLNGVKIVSHKIQNIYICQLYVFFKNILTKKNNSINIMTCNYDKKKLFLTNYDLNEHLL